MNQKFLQKRRDIVRFLPFFIFLRCATAFGRFGYLTAPSTIERKRSFWVIWGENDQIQHLWFFVLIILDFPHKTNNPSRVQVHH